MHVDIGATKMHICPLVMGYLSIIRVDLQQGDIYTLTDSVNSLIIMYACITPLTKLILQPIATACSCLHDYKSWLSSQVHSWIHATHGKKTIIATEPVG